MELEIEIEERTTVPSAKALGVDLTSAEYGYEVTYLDELELSDEAEAASEVLNDND